jgi:hypothetical protein
MIAEGRLDGLHAPREPARLLAKRGLCGLGRVPGALRRLPRLVQGGVPSRAWRYPLCLVYAAPGPPVGSPDRSRQHLVRWLRGRRGHRRVGEQPVKFGDQRVVAGRVQGFEQRLPRAGLTRGVVCPHPRLGGAEHLLRGQAGQPGQQVRAENLVVTHLAKHLAEPLQLGAQVLCRGPGQDRRIGLQRAAQPPGRHAHLVHGVRGVLADERVKRPEPGGLRADVSHHHVASRRTAGEPAPSGRRGRWPRRPPGLAAVRRRQRHGRAVRLCLCPLRGGLCSHSMRPTQGSRRLTSRRRFSLPAPGNHALTGGPSDEVREPRRPRG